MSLVSLTTVVLTASALSGCGSEVRKTPPVASPSPTVTSGAHRESPVVDLGGVVVAQGILMQRASEAPVQLCIGGVLDSYPPQCEGPNVAGEFSWDGLGSTQVTGIRWTEGSVWAVGHFDPDAGKTGTFTLSEPIRRTPPAGIPTPSNERIEFPQLCDDPYAGGDRKTVGSPDAGTNVLMERLPNVDGYVGSWVSDGSSLFNVLVTGDAQAARAELRTVWKGGLCVEQRPGLPTETDVNSAQEALGKEAKDLGLLSYGGDSMGSLRVEVVVLEQATRDRILEVVRPWLTPDQVKFSGMIQPLAQ